MNDREQVDRFLAEAMGATSSYVDLDEAAAAIRECLQVVHKQAAALNEVDYKTREWRGQCQCKEKCGHKVLVRLPWKPDELARAMAHSAKVLDEVVRLAAFAKGAPYSRPDLGGNNRDILQMLSPKLIAMIEAEVAAAMARE